MAETVFGPKRLSLQGVFTRMRLNRPSATSDSGSETVSSLKNRPVGDVQKLNQPQSVNKCAT